MNPPRNRKGEAGNPPSTTGALELYPNKRTSVDLSKHHSDDAKTGAGNVFREQRGRNLLTGYAASGIQEA